MDSRKYQNAITRVAEYYDITVSDVETAIDIYLKGKLPPSEEKKEIKPSIEGEKEKPREFNPATDLMIKPGQCKYCGK